MSILSLITHFAMILLSPSVNAEVLDEHSSEIGLPFIRNFKANNYDAKPANWGVVQGINGLIYIANEDGVLEYDGVNWRKIVIDNESHVRSLAVDEKGVVYVGGISEFGFLSVDDKGQMGYRSLLGKVSAKDRRFLDIWSIHPTAHGVYFVALDIIFRWHGGRMDTISCKKENFGFTVGDDVFVFHKLGGISQLHQGRLSMLPQTEEFSKAKFGRVSIMSYPGGKLFVATEKKGCFIYHLNEIHQPKQPVTSLLQAFPTQADDYLRRNSLYYIGARTRDGSYIFPTIKGGIVIMDSNGNLQRVIDAKQGLAGNATSSVFIDRDQNLWVTTLNGISYLEINSPWTKFETQQGTDSILYALVRHEKRLYVGAVNGVHYLKVHGEDNPDGNSHLAPVENASKQCFALSSFGGYLLAGIDNQVYMIEGDRAKMISKLVGHRTIYSIVSSSRFPEHIFVGMMGGMIAMKIEIAPGEKSKDGKQVGQHDITATQVEFNVPEIANEWIIEILQDNDGDLWMISQTNGVVQIKFGQSIQDHQVIHYGIEQGLPTLASNWIQWVDDQLLVSNSQGIYRAVESDGNKNIEPTIRFVPYTTIGKYLPGRDLGVFGLFTYGKDFIVDTFQGPGILLKQPDDTFMWDDTTFRVLPKVQDNTRRWYFDPDGTIWVIWNKTLYRYNPRIEKQYSSDYLVLLRKVETTQGRTLFLGNYHDSAKGKDQDQNTSHDSYQPKSSVPKLPFEQNSIIFHYSAVFFEQSIKTRYRYQLDGFEKNWSNWTHDAKREYNYLPEGDYIFRVKSKNVYGQESREQSYRFSILPPWYKTNLAYIGYGVIMLLAMMLCVRLYSWRLIKAKKRLEDIVMHRTLEMQKDLDRIKKQKNVEIEESMEHLKKTQSLLETASQRAEMVELTTGVLHNVGNVLTSVNVSSNIIKEKLRENKISRLQDLVRLLKEHENDLSKFLAKDSKGKKIPLYLQMLEECLSSEQMTMMDEMARLQSSIDHIKTIVGVQQHHAKTGGILDIVSLEKIVDEALVVSGLSIGDNGIKIVKDIENIPPILVEPFNVMQILVNLMNNAKYSMRASKKKEKTLTVQIEKTQSDQVIINISDNGIGISKKDMAKIFSYGFSTKKDGHGFGLHGSVISAKEMGGNLTCYSEGNEKGACFQLELPFRTNHTEEQ